MTTLLAAENLQRHYRVGGGPFRAAGILRAVDGVSFALAPRHTLAVVGESGSGKSTLGRMVSMIEPPTEGRLTIGGREVTSLDRAERKALRRAVQVVFQDPFGSLNPRKKIGDILAEPLIINTPLRAAEREEKCRALLAKVGLRPEHYARYPHMFSGGQRQRVAIARALMLEPDIVVADEAVSALDVSIQAQVLNLMMDLQEEFDLAYLFISHDLSVVRHIADELLVLYLGRPVEQGDKAVIFDRPRHPYTRALLASTPSVDPERRGARTAVEGELPSPLNPPAGCAFNTRCPHATERCRAERPALRPVDGRQVACHHAEEIA
ncbi:MAG: dipeptide ABC transporter ATP-binding protein [Azospirillaceae bacterium]